VYPNGIGGRGAALREEVEKMLAKGFVAIVTMDPHGGSLHADVERITGEALHTLRRA
jgi:hypothetical protein